MPTRWPAQGWMGQSLCWRHGHRLRNAPSGKRDNGRVTVLGAAAGVWKDEQPEASPSPRRVGGTHPCALCVEAPHRRRSHTGKKDAVLAEDKRDPNGEESSFSQSPRDRACGHFLLAKLSTARGNNTTHLWTRYSDTPPDLPSGCDEQSPCFGAGWGLGCGPGSGV